MSKIRQAVIPAAGLGSRFLPVTKQVPKELLPMVDKPCVQNVIEEALAAGVEEFILVISRQKQLIESYFRPNEFLDEWLLKRNNQALYEQIKAIEGRATYKFAYQDEPLGLGHAVLCAQPFITDEHFFVILPDDILDADEPVCAQMVQAFAENPKPLVSVMQVPWADVFRYGIVKAAPLSESLGRVDGIVEKPARDQAPSNLAVIGRYLLPQSIFALLADTKPGAGGEIQLTDALQKLIAGPGLNSFAFAGDRYDTGNPLGLLKASVCLSLKHPQFADEMKQLIKLLASTL